MPEVSHEIGRRQVMTFIHLMKRLSCSELEVQHVGDAYRTPSRTVLRSSLAQTASFDAIIDVRRGRGPIHSWHIESKGGSRMSNATFQRYFEDFVVNAYGVEDAWKDPRREHTALYVFLTNKSFDSPLYIGEQLSSPRTHAALKRNGIKRPDQRVVASLINSVRIFVMHEWFQSAIEV